MEQIMNIIAAIIAIAILSTSIAYLGIVMSCGNNETK